MMEAHTAGPRANRARDAELAAKRAVDDARAALEAGRRRIGVLESQVRPLSMESGHTAESGHRHADDLAGAAEERFRAELRDYLDELRTVVRDAPDPPRPSLVAAFVLARGGDEFYAALHHAIDEAVDDPSTAVFNVASEGEIKAAIEGKHAEVRAAEVRVTELEDELRRAEATYNEAIEGR